MRWFDLSRPSRVVAIGRGSATFARALHRRHRVVVIDPERSGVAHLLSKAPTAVPLVAQAEALPVRSRSVDQVVLAQGFHRLAPGLALAEFARVLAPGGRLALSYTVRDDSVPWVRRLVSLLREVDPEAMSGDYGVESVSAVGQHPCFPDVETREFRLWSPVNRPALVQMVARTSTARALDEQGRAALLAEVGSLYDASARPPEPLLLPYRVMSWLAAVDHSEMSAPLQRDGGLSISL